MDRSATWLLRFVRSASQGAGVPDLPENSLMLLQTIKHQIRQNTRMLGTNVDPCMNRAFFTFLLAELKEKFKGVMPDLEEVRIAALFPTPVDGRITFGIVNTHDEPASPKGSGRETELCCLTHSPPRNSFCLRTLLMPEALCSAFKLLRAIPSDRKDLSAVCHKGVINVAAPRLPQCGSMRSFR